MVQCIWNTGRDTTCHWRRVSPAGLTGVWILSFSLSVSLSILQLHLTCRSCGSSAVPCERLSNVRHVVSCSCGFNTAHNVVFRWVMCEKSPLPTRRSATARGPTTTILPSTPTTPFLIGIHPSLPRDASSSPGRPRSGMSNAFRGRGLWPKIWRIHSSAAPGSFNLPSRSKLILPVTLKIQDS